MSGLTLTATALAGMVLGCAVVGGVGQVAVGRARADATADLAALAAAAQLARGEPGDVACAVAAQVAAAPSGVRPLDGVTGSQVAVAGCVPNGVEVTVQVTALVKVLGVTAPVTGRARAGPVPPG